MSAFSLSGLVAEVAMALLGALASPFGGRDIGRGFLKIAGLRRGPSRRK
jgi:hypothetical protein